MSFFFGFPLSSETNIAILALSGETTWFKEQVMASYSLCWNSGA